MNRSFRACATRVVLDVFDGAATGQERLDLGGAKLAPQADIIEPEVSDGEAQYLPGGLDRPCIGDEHGPRVLQRRLRSATTSAAMSRSLRFER